MTTWHPQPLPVEQTSPEAMRALTEALRPASVAPAAWDAAWLTADDQRAIRHDDRR